MRDGSTLFDIWSVQIELIVSECVKQWMRKWCVVKHGCKNGYLKDTCLKEIGLHTQNMLIIIGLIVNIIFGWVGG